MERKCEPSHKTGKMLPVLVKIYTFKNNGLNTFGQLLARNEQHLARFLRKKSDWLAVSP